MHPHAVGWRVAVLVVVSAAVGHASPELAQSRIIYLAHDGVHLRPGANDSIAGTSTVVTEPVAIPPWTTTPEVWSDTVACVSEIYSRFAVTVTDVDPGDAPHIEAVFGGSPVTLGLSRSYAGMSPFADDCGIIENSVVFTFTEILAGDAHSACQVMAQEIAHSYGLDHELLDSDPMTYLPYTGDREFADQDVACGETTARPCGLAGSTCRATQNSYALLAERVGLVGTTEPPTIGAPPPDQVGCSATGGSGWGALPLLALAALRRARRR